MRKLVFALTCLLISSLIMAGDMTGAAAAGTGGTLSSSGTAGQAVFGNPALLVDMADSEYQIFSGYGNETDDMDSAYSVFSGHFDNVGLFAVGFSYMDNGIQELPGVKDKNEFMSSAGVTYANRFLYLIKYGVTAKGYYAYLFGENIYGYGLDAGLIYQPYAGLELFIGIFGSNIAGEMIKDENRSDLESQYTLGTSLLILDGWVNLKYDVAKSERSVRYISKTGIEVNIFDLVTVRGGLDDMNLCLGAGVKYTMYEVDYAYLKYDSKEIHKVSLNLTW